MTTKLNMYAYEIGETEEFAIEVPTDWLTRKVKEHEEMDLQEFLDSYTSDTINWLHELAVKEEQILSIENPIVILDGYKFRENYLRDAIEHFNTSVNELEEISDKLDLKVYPTYRDFFESYFLNTYDTKEQLIELMFDGYTEPPDKDYFILENGEVIHIYP